MTIGVAVLALLAGVGYWYGAPKYTTHSIPIWAYPSHVRANEIWWIDNDRVVFTGADPNIVVPSENPNRPSELLAIYIWDTKRNEYKRYAELNVLGRVTCYEHGTIKYFVQGPVDKSIGVQRIDGYQAVLGQDPQPWVVAPKVDGVARGLWLMSRFGCTAMWETDLARPEHTLHENIIRPLWSEDGYLYSPSNSRDKNYPSLMWTPVQMWRPGAQKGIPLPIMIKELSGTSLYFSDYKNVYILPAGVRGDETRPSIAGYLPGKERPVYFISRNGDVETKWFPNEDWVAVGEGFLPTVSGHFVISNFTRRAQSLDAGAWLITKSRSHKLIDNLIDEFSVSPNGCKAVVSIANPDKKPQFSRSMTVFNFCDAGGGK